MSLIERYLENAGGPWIRAERVKVGDTVTIERVDLDDESFDRPYIVLDGVYDPTGEAVKVRLGVKNVRRIAKSLGTDERRWVGQKIEVIDIEEYKGLGQKGILWRGLIPVKRPSKMSSILEEPGSQPGLETLEWLQSRRALINSNIPISGTEWNNMPPVVKRELERFGLVEMRWDYPYLAEKARKYIK